MVVLAVAPLPVVLKAALQAPLPAAPRAILVRLRSCIMPLPIALGIIHEQPQNVLPMLSHEILVLATRRPLTLTVILPPLVLILIPRLRQSRVVILAISVSEKLLIILVWIVLAIIVLMMLSVFLIRPQLVVQIIPMPQSITIPLLVALINYYLAL